MPDKDLTLKGRVCDVDFTCRFFPRICSKQSGQHVCVLQLAVDVVREAVLKGVPVQEVMNDDFSRHLETLNPPMGFILPDGKWLVSSSDKKEVFEWVREEAERLFLEQ